MRMLMVVTYSDFVHIMIYKQIMKYKNSKVIKNALHFL